MVSSDRRVEGGSAPAMIRSRRIAATRSAVLLLPNKGWPSASAASNDSSVCVMGPPLPAV